MIDFSKAFPERLATAARAEARDRYERLASDPFDGFDDEDSLGKTVRHYFEERDRVRVNAPTHHAHGHVGIITDARNDSNLTVKLDSGHIIHAPEWELVPEDFPTRGNAESGKVVKSPDQEVIAGFERAGASPEDLAVAHAALAKIAGGRAASPFGELVDDSPLQTLRNLAQKYANGGDSNVLSKRASFKVGDRVTDRLGRSATVTRADVTHCDVDYGNGVTGLCLLGELQPEAT